MKEFTKDDINELRKASVMKRMMADVFGLDLDAILDKIESEINEKEPNEQTGELQQNNETYITPEANVKQIKPKLGMTYLEFESFINDFETLISSVKKVDYIYGINLTDTSNPTGISGKVSDVIWALVRALFGEENAEDIADYLYGNSNFDTPKDLFEELI